MLLIITPAMFDWTIALEKVEPEVLAKASKLPAPECETVLLITEPSMLLARFQSVGTSGDSKSPLRTRLGPASATDPATNLISSR